MICKSFTKIVLCPLPAAECPVELNIKNCRTNTTKRKNGSGKKFTLENNIILIYHLKLYSLAADFFFPLPDFHLKTIFCFTIYFHQW
jgi:hypothetical protein